MLLEANNGMWDFTMFDSPDSAGVHRWPVLKLRAGSKCSGVLLGSRFLPLSSHWVGRTVPCPGENCRLCPILPVRGLYYLPISVEGRASILEMSPVASANLEQHARLLHSGLTVGQLVEFSRRGAKSPIHAEIVEQRVGVNEVPFLMFVSRVMSLYHLPAANPSESIEAYEKRLRAISLLRAEREYEQQMKRAAPHRVS